MQNELPSRSYTFAGPLGNEKMDLIDNRKIAQDCLCLQGDSKAPSVDDLFRGYKRKQA